MGILVLGAIVLVVAGVAVAVVALLLMLRRSSRAQLQQSTQLYPGRSIEAPEGWALGHSPEARLFRRIRDALTPLHNAPGTDISLIDGRVQIELAADDVAQRLVALSAVDRSVAEPVLARAEWWVGALESVTGRLILGQRLEVGELEQVTKQNPFSG
ncbi:hypothetical protein GII33_17125 [Gordonia pseudamarae]|jgi:hypothetical protein|uniref:Uncharacterized protein n=1 Tax=Gordonia pseudamarae TaxID=2831662 RepID=A0ABX6ILQ5_9ACTN|nr:MULTISPECIES: hypothetical protein [Gordonia]MBD0024428.1 hypothetical protein [Gordonia sp. (in: high G+C Gram-positive bacteria)]QHN27415.1 hypothetical protein GII33_17125 [Gordonia pseudamarae]QHN36299.1 hypothetical protein GII31_16900 [Gordonia pseudamarae]